MEINEVSEQCELSPKSNSTITHQLNTLELINNCVESQEIQSKLENCDENSSNRILHQNGIQMHQSACRDLDQSQHSSSSSSKHAAANSYDFIGNQSAIASRQPSQPKRYKRGRRGRTNYIAISDLEADTSTEKPLGSSTDTNSRSTFGSAMAQTKQSEHKTDRDRPPRATYPYVCGVCGKQSTQSTNHRRHMITKHGIRSDGHKATPEEIERARARN